MSACAKLRFNSSYTPALPSSPICSPWFGPGVYSPISPLPPFPSQVLSSISKVSWSYTFEDPRSAGAQGDEKVSRVCFGSYVKDDCTFRLFQVRKSSGSPDATNGDCLMSSLTRLNDKRVNDVVYYTKHANRTSRASSCKIESNGVSGGGALEGLMNIRNIDNMRGENNNGSNVNGSDTGSRDDRFTGFVEWTKKNTKAVTAYLSFQPLYNTSPISSLKESKAKFVASDGTKIYVCMLDLVKGTIRTHLLEELDEGAEHKMQVRGLRWDGEQGENVRVCVGKIKEEGGGRKNFVTWREYHLQEFVRATYTEADNEQVEGHFERYSTYYQGALAAAAAMAVGVGIGYIFFSNRVPLPSDSWTSSTSSKAIKIRSKLSNT